MSNTQQDPNDQNNKKKKHKTDGHGNNAPVITKTEDGFFNSAFWDSWLGRFLAIYALLRVIPQDRMLDQAMIPSAGYLDSLATHIANKGRRGIHSAKRFLARYGRKSIGIAAWVIVITQMIVVFSIAKKSTFGVALGDGALSMIITWACYLVMGSVTLFTESLNLTGTVLGGVLRTIGLAKFDDAGKQLRIDNHRLRAFAGTLSAVIALTWTKTAILVFLTYIAKEPPWAPCLTVIVSMTMFTAAWANKGANVPHRWFWKLGVLCMSFAFLTAGIPTFPAAASKVRDVVTDWVANPTLGNGAIVLLVAIFLIFAVSFAAKAYYGPTEPRKSAMYGAISKTAGWMIVPAVIMLCMFGGITPEQVGAARGRLGANMSAAGSHPLSPTGLPQGGPPLVGDALGLSQRPAPSGRNADVIQAPVPSRSRARALEAPPFQPPAQPQDDRTATAPTPVRDYSHSGIDDIAKDL